MSELLNKVIYDTLTNNISGEMSTFFVPNTTAPKLTTVDYTRGSIARWFVRKLNDGPPIETDESGWNAVSTDWWLKSSVNWKISGQRNSSTINGLTTVGVEEHNRKAISSVEKTIPDIRVILNDPLQFWRP
jgi:hypothetical protein